MRVVVLCFLFWIIGVGSGVVSADTGSEIIEASGVSGGLVVHLGCGDGRFTAELGADERYTVQGLGLGRASLVQARRHIQSTGRYGRVSVNYFSGDRLPYIDNMVNLLIVEKPGVVSSEELLRVLVPGGLVLVREESGWSRTVKPRPGEMDDWSHFLHGADGNAVADDSLVDFPFHLQWAGGPRYARSHNGISTVNTVVSDGKRIYYFADDSPVALPEQIPSEWTLIARDAFNGLRLWERPLTCWQARNSRSRHNFPQDLHRRLVAGRDHLYTTLTIFGPLSALDPETGVTVRDYDRTRGTEEILYHEGRLYLVVDPASPGKTDRGLLARMLPAASPKRVVALDAGSGRILWSKNDDDTVGLVQMSTTVKGDNLVFRNSRELICLDAGSGKVIWRTGKHPTGVRPVWGTPTIVITGETVLCADQWPVGKKVSGGEAARGIESYKSLKNRKVSSELVAYERDTGEELWRISSSEGSHISNEFFVIDGLVWAGEIPHRSKQDYRLGRDIRTGEVKVTIPPSASWVSYHHHRCYRDKATSRFILAGRTGVEFIDPESGRVTPHHWIRGICKFGILPCNGLLYIPPKQCSCYQESMLTGFNALAPDRGRSSLRTIPPFERLITGPAYEESSVGEFGQDSFDWPTYRSDAARSGSTDMPLQGPLKREWKVEIPGRLTATTVAAGTVYVASVDRHVLYALDAESGEKLWRYTVAARVDSPPTVSRGLVIFGSRDGRVYALRATDGALAWRYRAAPGNQQLMAHGQCESVWPVHGSVLVEDERVYFVAGRNSHLDGGVFCSVLDLETGSMISERCHYSRGSDGSEKAIYPPFSGAMLPDRELPGVLPDVPSGVEEFVFLRGAVFNRSFEPAGEYVQHLYSGSGFLDDTWYKRLFWFYGNHQFSGLAGRGFNRDYPSCGRIMVADDRAVYAYKDYSIQNEGLFAIKKTDDLGVFDAEFPSTKQEWKKQRKDMKKRLDSVYLWRLDVPFYVRGMVSCAENLVLAGPPKHEPEAVSRLIGSNAVDLNPPPRPLLGALEAWRGMHGGKLWIVNKQTGKKEGEYELSSPPVHDGMAVARKGVFISGMDGTVQYLKADTD